MPIVRIDYEKDRISREEMRKVAEGIQGLVAEATKYELADVCVFASENQITVNATPVEIYVQATFANASEEDLESMLAALRDSVIVLKKQIGISVPFNLSVVKMHWKFQLEV